jgi:hypothetical protein
MKIYPDPELPDVEVSWFAIDCGQAPSTITIELIGIDTPATHLVQTAPCTLDTEATLAYPDLARERYRLTGSVLDSNNQPASRAESFEDIDLRNGNDITTSLFFDTLNDISVAWTFADDTTTCASLVADTVQLRFSPQGKPMFTVERPCEFGSYFGGAASGVYTVSARALSSGATVATSPESPPVTVDEKQFVDIGPLTLTACAPDCP